MSAIPTSTPVKKEALDDNARKFTLVGLDAAFLDQNDASSFVLTTDWLETDKDSEKKLARKKFPDGSVQMLLISKVTKDGKRTSVKEKISDEKYNELKSSSILQVEKMRYEFNYSQDGTEYEMKYDEFANSELRILEVDASSEQSRDSFNPASFPAELQEVTGDIRYYGYRVAEII